jgi:hypothetical protein
VSAPSPSNERSAENRRTTRVIHAVPVTIRGTDALEQPFEELTSTVTVNCNGCKYESRHYVPKGSKITIEIGGREQGLRPRKFAARVVWVQRPRTYREIFHIALEFEVPGNVWGIKSPPNDWFLHPDDEELIIPVYPEAGEPELLSVPMPALAQESNASAVHMQAAAAHAVSAISTPTPAVEPHDIGLTLVQPPALQKNKHELDAARQMLRTVVEAALSENRAMLRELLESNLQDVVQETVSTLGDRIADQILKAVAEHAAERAAGVVAEAREASPENVEELDAKICGAAREGASAQPKSARKATSAKRRRKSAKNRETD